MNKIQEDEQNYVRLLYHELGKGNSAEKSHQSLTEIRYLINFNQYDAFCLVKANEAYFCLCTWPTLSLLFGTCTFRPLKARDQPEYVVRTPQCTSPVRCLVPDAVLRKTEDETLKYDSEGPYFTAPGDLVKRNLTVINLTREKADFVILWASHQSVRHGSPLGSIGLLEPVAAVLDVALNPP